MLQSGQMSPLLSVLQWLCSVYRIKARLLASTYNEHHLVPPYSGILYFRATHLYGVSPVYHAVILLFVHAVLCFWNALTLFIFLDRFSTWLPLTPLHAPSLCPRLTSIIAPFASFSKPGSAPSAVLDGEY